MLLVLVLAICVPVAVWFYFWQNEVKTRQVSVRSLLWLILAVSIGLSFGSWIAGPTIRRGLGLPWAQWQAESRRSSPRGRRAAARQFCPTDCLVPAVALR
jgi:hypothetical protein